MMNRRTMTAGLVAAAAGLPRIGPAQASVQSRAKAVLELFTSQGCSSCPAADAVLATYAQRPDVVALSFNVDYWDHLGWKDTLASPKATKRQRYYAKARGDGQVYTPQMVVNGRGHLVGSDRAAIDRAIGQAASVPGVAIKIDRDGPHLTIGVGPRPDNSTHGEMTLWLAYVARRREVTIKRGENTGKALIYTNVVRDATAVGVWTGDALTVRIDPQSAMPSDADTVAAVLQHGMSGPIIGGAMLSLTA